MSRLRTAVSALAVCAAIGWGGVPSVAKAHTGNPPDIAFWGPFDPGAAVCQRVAGDTAQRCFEHVLGIERRCMDAQLAGQPCDPAARDAQIAAAKQATQEDLTAACSETQLQQLHFKDLNEAEADVALACGDQADAAMSVLYGPALASGSTASGNPDMRRCLAQTAALGQKLLHFASRVKRRALDRIALRSPTAEQRLAFMGQASARIAAVRQKVVARIEQACPAFSSAFGGDMTHFLAGLEPRADCVVGLSYVQSAATCPKPVCGNGVKETGEQCDDGNSVDDDLCHNTCTKNDCSVFPSTFALIQAAIFENHSCTNDLCHGAARSGNLDLRAGASYANLVGTASLIDPSLKRVEPGDSTRSLLWLKLAAATLGRTGVPGTPMPSGLPALSNNELEAVRLWIHAAAPETGNVLGVPELLDACAVPADPIQIQPLEPPAPGTGVQLHMPAWKLPAHSENEVCFATSYDLTNQVPAQFRGPAGTTFRFHRQDIVQDPQSHHLIVNLYTGSASIDDGSWGPFTCKGGAFDGHTCYPTRADDGCGTAGLCGSEPTRSVACIGFGPPDAQLGGFAGFTGTQQTSYEQALTNGVYEEVPLKGIIIWNSHAFNLTQKDAKQEAWLNFYFAQPADQQYPVQGVFDLTHIFDMMVPPFQTEEVCATHILEQGARLFQLSSHMHKRGKRFTIFAPDGHLMYTSNIYNDPVQLKIDPPLVFDNSDPTTRTLRYCALYDNGATDPGEVKRKSTSPPTPLGFSYGGPCAMPTGCTAGNVGQKCVRSTNQTKLNASCDTSPGAGDGVCDACPLTGGVTTEDEMFILLGSYYVP